MQVHGAHHWERGERRFCEPIIPSGEPSEAEEAEMAGACAEGWRREFGKGSSGQDVQRVHQGQQDSSRHCVDGCTRVQDSGGTDGSS